MSSRTVVACVLVVGLISLAWMAGGRGTAPQTSGTRASDDGQRPDAAKCHAMWTNGVEGEGWVGERATYAYFDMADLNGSRDRVSGIVMPAAPQPPGPLADTVVGLHGGEDDADCDVQLHGSDGDDDSVWQLRIDSIARITGTHRTMDGRTEPVAFDIVPETPCDGAGEWRTFSAPQWPITFDYPANWKLTADDDDINLECPSAKALAFGGAFLTFERGQFPPPNAKPVTPLAPAFTEPYWFVRRADDDWRVKDHGCDAPDAGPDRVECHRARRSQRNGMTLLQGEAGEHRLYRPGGGDIGQGTGITRYLWVLGDRWISLDSTERSHTDLGTDGGPVLIDGNDVGDRVVRSVRPRASRVGRAVPQDALRNGIMTRSPLPST